MTTYELTSGKTGRTFDVEFELDPSEADVDEAVAYTDDLWFRQQGEDPSVAGQGALGTAANQVPRTLGTVVPQLVGSAAKILDAGTDAIAKWTGSQKLGVFEKVADVSDDLEREVRRAYPVNPLNSKTATVVGGATQGLSLLAGGVAAKAVGLGEAALTAVPLWMGGVMGAGEGIDKAKEIGVESPEAQLAMGLLFGAVEAGTEKLGGFGNKAATDALMSQFRKPAAELLKEAVRNIGSESLEEVAAGSAQDLLTRAFAMEDPKRPGFTLTGVELPKMDRQMLERRGLEALGGAAGGAVFAGVNALNNSQLPQSATATKPAVRREAGAAEIYERVADRLPATEFDADLATGQMTDEERVEALRFGRWIGSDVPGAITTYRERFGNHISADNARELNPLWARSKQDRQRLSGALGVPAGKLAQQVYDAAVGELEGGVVLMLGGGQGSGKTSALSEEVKADVDVIYDNTLSNLPRAASNIEKAVAGNNEVVVNFVYKPLGEAVPGAIERAGDEGRIEGAAQMARTHQAAQRVFLELQRRFAGNDRVTFLVTDATGVFPGSGKAPVAMSVEDLGAKVYTQPLAELQNMAQGVAREHFSKYPGRFSEDFQQRVLRGPGSGTAAKADAGNGATNGGAGPGQRGTAEPGPAGSGNGGPGASSVKEWENTTFGQRLKADDRLREAWRATIGGKYRVESEAEWQQRANDFIESQGVEGAFALLMDLESGLSPSDQIALGLQLLLTMDNEIRTAPAERAAILDELLYETAEHIELLGTRYGQGVRVFGMWTRMSADGVLRTFERKVDESREKDLTIKMGGKPEDIAADVSAAAAEEHADAAAEALGETASEQLAELQRQVEQLRQQLAKATAEAQAAQQEATQASTPAEAAQATKRAESAEKGRQRAQRDLSKATARQQRKTAQAGKPKVSNGKKPKPVNAEEIAKAWIDRLATSQSDTPPAFRQAQVNALTLLIREYLKAEQNALPDFIGGAVALSVPAATAEQLRGLLDNERKAIAAIARERAIARLVDQLTPMASTAATKKKVPRLVQKLFDAHELGALQRPEFLKAYAEAFELPIMDAAMRQRIKALIDKQKAVPEGYLKQQATTELMGELALFKGIGALDIGTAFWYANILSGVSTQGINLLGNAVHLMLKTLTVGATHNPKETWHFIRGMAEGAKRGSIEAVGTLRDGGVPYRGDLTFTSGQTLELIHSEDPQTWSARFKNGLALGRFVFRALSAGDAFFYHTAREGRAWLEAARYAREQENLNGGVFSDYLAEQLNHGQERFRQAAEQARREIEEAGLPINFGTIDRRSWEILESKRPPELLEQSQRFGTIATFTQDPSGAFGALARVFNNMHREFTLPSPWGPLRLLTPVVPFVNIVANFASASLDYTPIGIIRGATGRHLNHVLDRSQKDFSPWEAKQRLASGVMGTLTAGLLYAWAAAFKDRDDDEVPFMIYGMGPATKARRDQMPKGWKPYTLKIGDTYVSYSETPLVFALSVAGGFLDKQRYGNKDVTAPVAAGGYVMSLFGGALLKTGMLSSADDIFSMLSGEKSVTPVLTRTLTGFIPGQGLLRDISELIHGDKIDDTTMAAAMFKDIPFVRELVGRPALNIFGEPVQLDTMQTLPVIKRLVTRQGEDPDALWLARNKLWLPGLDNQITVGTYLTEQDKMRTRGPGWREDRIRQQGRGAADVLTPEERYDFVRKSGPGIRKAVQEMQREQTANPKLDREQLQERLKAKVVARRRIAMREVMGVK